MKSRTLAAIAVLGLLAPAAPAAAQLPIELRITPRAGAVTPAGWFYVQYQHFGVSPLEWTEAAIDAAPVVGLTAEIELPGTGVWVRGQVLRTLGAQLAITHLLLRPPSGFNPAEVIRTPYRIDAALTVGSLDLALPTRLRLPGGIQPYVTAGLGAKRYDFDVAPIEAYGDQIVLPQPGVTFTANVGGGATLDVLGFTLDFLVQDAISDYWASQQHDVMVLLGLAWKIL